MRFIFTNLCLLLLIFVAVCMAQQESQPSNSAAATPPPQARAEIAGQVVDAVSGQALKKAWINARPSERGARNTITTVTDAEGRFDFKNLEPGRYQLIAQRNGYVRQSYGQKAQGEAGAPITVAAGQKFADIVFRLVQGGVISGRVVDEDGEPLVRANVLALEFRYMSGKRKLVPVGTAASDDRGEYRIFGIRPGQVYVRAGFRGHGGFFDSGTEVETGTQAQNSYAPMFYPNVAEASQATAITLHGGDELHADFTLLPERAYSVSGRVTGGVPGASGRGAWLVLTPRDQTDLAFNFGGQNNSFTDSDNKFTFKHVLPGSYYLMAQQNEEGRGASGRIPVDVRQDNVQGLVVSLAPRAEIAGHISIDNGNAGKLAGIRVSLVPDEIQSFMGGDSAQVKDDGSFTLHAAPEEHYKLSVYGAGPEMYLRSAVAGREDVLEKGLTGGSSRSLDIVLAPGGQLTGAVKNADGSADAGVSVVLIPESPLAGLSDDDHTAVTDQNGNYKLIGLRPGRYRAYAFEHMEPGAYQDEEWLERYANDAKSIDIGTSTQQTLDLKPILAATGE
jgi:protocatechuate 3,4-dioxygenase beta subunit